MVLMAKKRTERERGGRGRIKREGRRGKVRRGEERGGAAAKMKTHGIRREEQAKRGKKG